MQSGATAPGYAGSTGKRERIGGWREGVNDPGRKHMRRFGVEKRFFVLHGSPPVRPRKEGGRGGRRTGGLSSNGAPASHLARRGAQSSRPRVLSFLLSQFLGYLPATTAIRVVHLETSYPDSSSTRARARITSLILWILSESSSGHNREIYAISRRRPRYTARWLSACLDRGPVHQELSCNSSAGYRFDDAPIDHFPASGDKGPCLLWR